MPFRNTKVENMRTVLHLPDGKRIIVHSREGSFRVWDLETGTQVGEEWEDKDYGAGTIALSPDGKKIASGGLIDSAVKLWDVDTGKVIKILTGHTNSLRVKSVSWSPDGGRVVSGLDDGTFRVWDVESGKTILGPINAGDNIGAVCYSPDAKMIATGSRLKIWDANSGELLKTFEKVSSTCLAWTSDGKTLIAAGAGITKIDTATWTVLDSYKWIIAFTISLSPNERILAIPSSHAVELWDLDTIEPIGTPPHHQGRVNSATFSADGKFLVTCCKDHICTWDVSIIKEPSGKKPAASSSQRSNTHTTQQYSTPTQNTPSSSQLPPPNAAVASTPGTMGAPSRPHSIVAEWRARCPNGILEPAASVLPEPKIPQLRLEPKTTMDMSGDVSDIRQLLGQILMSLSTLKGIPAMGEVMLVSLKLLDENRQDMWDIEQSSSKSI
ncbi:hypothetical protein CY34DRAFT_11561 [Suillus luteus UH-Slu-Lm8-n1]|uniref:WD40 repeat-like protein n=1 Tax=Suillus luteus UH-Slu-Lm8-n1 TaxID=930992 RepID=A0A0D0A1A3_9AGAM|nr:hypothetical protein CY34DRAFT_11561 [Suillus luteus UH-Slu-Lm8-n1]